jgi:hypothetical protein
MALTSDEFSEFKSIQIFLNIFLAKSAGILPRGTTVSQYQQLKHEDKTNISNKLFKVEGLFDAFKHSHVLSETNIATVNDLSNGFRSKFIVLNCQIEFAVFIDTKTSKYYKVIPLSQPFRELIPNFPTEVETTLFPFNGRIVYDGYMALDQEKLTQESILSLNKGYVEALQNETIITYFDKPQSTEKYILEIIKAPRHQQKNLQKAIQKQNKNNTKAIQKKKLKRKSLLDDLDTQKE